MSEERNEEWSELHRQAEALSESLYPTIGEFAVAFEALCHALRMGIGIVLEANGLRNGRLTDILVGDLTVFPLQSTYRSLLSETQDLDELEHRLLDDIFKRITKLSESRNGILHAAWFIDFKDPEDIRNGLLTRHRPGSTKKGAKADPGKFPISDIKALTREARVLDALVHELNMCTYSKRRILDRFSFNSQGETAATGSIMDYFKTGK